MPEIHLMMPLTWSYSRELVRGLRTFARERGDWRLVWLANLGQLGSRLRIHGEPDGIVAMVRANAEMRTLHQWRIPTVNVSGHFRSSSLPRVMPDQAAIGELAARHLLDRGYEHFVFVGGEEEQFADDRHAAFAAAVTAAGHPCRRFRVDDFIAGRATRDWPGPTGVLLYLDDIGAEVESALRAADLAIPDDAALVGVNDDEVFCDLAEVPLTSIDPGMRRIGYEAGATLAALLAGEEVEPDRCLPPVGVVQRASSDGYALDDPVLHTALACIRDHACDPINVAELVPMVGVSRRTLEQRFRERLGRTLYEEILRVRHERARQLLQGTDLPLQEVCTRSGFSYLNRFSAQFRRRHGLPPAAYRRRYRD